MDSSAPSGQTLSINGMEMYYVIKGKGEPLVLLHGFTGSSGDWGQFQPDLEQEYQLIMPDMRGHGRTTNSLPVFTFRQAALDIFALLDQIGIGQFKAIGVSAGGNALLHMATQQPERITAMVLVSASSYFPVQTRQWMQQSLAIQHDSEDWQNMRARHHLGDDQIRWLWDQARYFKDSYNDLNFTPPYLSTIKARTLIVYGDRDQLYPIQIAMEMYAAIPNASLWVIPNGKHVPVFNNPVAPFTTVVMPFLRGDWEK